MVCVNNYFKKKEQIAPFSVLFHALVFLYRFGRDGGRGFRAVAYLRVGGGRAYRAPRLA